MRIPAAALALAVSAALPRLAPAADVPASSRVDAVTVSLRSARVTRVARLEVPAGDVRVLLAGLPDGLLDDTVRVEGKGTAQARLFGVSVERVTGAEAAAAEVRAAEERVERLQDEDRALEDGGRVAEARRRFVESLRSTYADERARNLAVRGVSSREWADLSRFVASELAAAGGEGRRVEAARRSLARKLEAARADLGRLSAKRTQTTKAVAVELHAERPGAVELALSYTVPQAWWSPAWDARLQPDASKVELALIGSVVNRSGEDWSGVRLAVSTAEPRRGLLVPKLEPHYLTRRRPEPVRAPAPATAGALGRKAAPAQARARDAVAAAEEETEAKLESIEEGRAAVEEGLLAATFVAPRRETVDGSGQARRIPLTRFSLAAQVGRIAAPRLDRAAWLTAKVVNETGVPLPPGSAGVWVGDEFMGRAPLAATPPGGELTLSFGADPRVEVERRVLERRHETAGLVSKDEVWRYAARITVKNRWSQKVAVKLLDLVPASRDEAIEVKVLEGTTPAAEDRDRPGVRVHELELGPRQERTVEIRWQVRFPRGVEVSGLE
ncbi:MAG TPA: mucoidy inhibitor MuiA family protein [Anaeromyxobacteraceae bacterium]